MRGMSTQTDIAAAVRSDAARAGERVYERRLKSLLEPANSGRVVAIHIPSEDYFLGDSLLEASDRLREKYPGAGRGEIYARCVGEPPVARVRTPRIIGPQR